MPFTPAHPAAILPLPRLMRQWSVPSALVIGSLAPDLAYFLPLDVPRTGSHSLAGLFWFCLPIGLLTYLLFHLFLKGPILSLLPDALAVRLSPDQHTARLPRVHVGALTLSLLLGACTHLLWDSFTHDNAPGVLALPWLRLDLFAIGTYHVYAYRVLQHFSSALGLTLLALWTFGWYRAARPGPRLELTLPPAQRLRAYACLLLIPALSGLIAALWQLSLPIHARMVENAVGRGVVTLFSSLGVVLLVFSLWWHLVPGRRELSNPRRPS